ncbi:MAG: hypothetical protein AB8G22_00295 [Saprospiraceae bacterium]
MSLNRSDWIYLLLLAAATDTIILHQIAQRILEWQLPFLDSYLDPFCCIPFLLCGFVLERRWLFKIKHFRLSLFDIAILTAGLSLLFEIGFPYFFPDFVFDVYDFVAYAVGAGVFYAVSEFADTPIKT